jgi:hypothetical protein
LAFWRLARVGTIHCSVCEPVKSHTLVAERLRANTEAQDPQLRRAMNLIVHEFNDAATVDAKAIIAAAEREKISVATLTRARSLLRIHSEKQPRGGWRWQRPPPSSMHAL